MKKKLPHSRYGGYCIPNLKLFKQPNKPVGKYGLMRVFERTLLPLR